jgi:tryptophanyl-tRNA synthetase
MTAVPPRSSFSFSSPRCIYILHYTILTLNANTHTRSLLTLSHTHTHTLTHTRSSELAGVDIVVGTPARLCSLAESKTLVLSQIRFYVLDEADALVTGDHYVPVSADPGPHIPDI